MELCLEFENVWFALMSQVPLPSLDICLNELLYEEHHFFTKAHLGQQNTENYNVAYVARGKPWLTIWVKCNVIVVKIAATFPHSVKFCNYCQKTLHIIVECRWRPQNLTPYTYAATSTMPFSIVDVGSSSVPLEPGSSVPFTPELVQHMIVHACSSFGISGSTKPFFGLVSWFRGIKSHDVFRCTPLQFDKI